MVELIWNHYGVCRVYDVDGKTLNGIKSMLLVYLVLLESTGVRASVSELKVV